MNSDLAAILALRKALETATEGMGMVQSLVRELRDLKPLGSEVARLLLLGFPLPLALEPLARCSSEEVSMLASLILSAPRSSAALVGIGGGAMAGTLERWIKAREGARMEQKALSYRGLVTSGILGGVTAMIASLGPVVGNLNFTATPGAVSPGALLYSAAGLVGIGSAMLGLFMSGRRFYLNVIVSLSVFALVGTLASPLANLSSISTWGIK